MEWMLLDEVTAPFFQLDLATGRWQNNELHLDILRFAPRNGEFTPRIELVHILSSAVYGHPEAAQSLRMWLKQGDLHDPSYQYLLFANDGLWEAIRRGVELRQGTVRGTIHEMNSDITVAAHSISGGGLLPMILSPSIRKLFSVLSSKSKIAEKQLRRFRFRPQDGQIKVVQPTREPFLQLETVREIPTTAHRDLARRRLF